MRNVLSGHKVFVRVTTDLVSEWSPLRAYLDSEEPSENLLCCLSGFNELQRLQGLLVMLLKLIAQLVIPQGPLHRC